MVPKPQRIWNRASRSQSFSVCRLIGSNWSAPGSELASQITQSFTSGQVPEDVKVKTEENEEEIRRKWREALLPPKSFLGMSQLTFARVFFFVNHFFAVFGLYFLLMGRFNWKILLFELIYSYCGALGTTIGAHRLWTHKSFKAKLPLKILLMIFQTITAHYTIYKWCLDHRIHHKYTDTDKDPHNSKRGFWFSHMLWAIQPKHPENVEAMKTFDMPDLEKDPVIRFQAKYYPWLVYFFYSFLPVFIAAHVLGCRRYEADCLNCLRWVYNIHISAAVNSFAHIWGDKPYDKNITSTDNKIVTFFAVGEGWHNYHHTFPWDYKASELGWKINFSTFLIDFFAKIGWAYDLKTVSGEMLEKKIKKSGDGSHPKYGGKEENQEELVEDKLEGKEEVDSTMTWGWDDENVSEGYRKMTTILNPGEEVQPKVF